MDLNINIQKLGTTDNIFGFYKYLNDEREANNHVLLESVSEDSHKMLFSFIGLNPDFMVKISGEDLEFYNIKSDVGDKMKDASQSIEYVGNEYEMPFKDEVPINMGGLDKLKEIFPISRTALPELFPRKVFSGGLLGYIGYDVVAPYVGYKPSTSSRQLFPDAIMGLFTTVLAYSHSTNTVYQITNTVGDYSPNAEINDLFTNFKKNKNDGNLKSLKFNKQELLKQNSGFITNTSLDEWIEMINSTKEHILSGDIVQAVISRKMKIEVDDVAPMDVYEALRILNPSPYMFFLNFHGVNNGNIHIIGSSPEALITKNQSVLETVPIAGTRRRGRNPDDEIRMENELLNSEKELAEHIMLVDLARNDLARVSVPGTIDTYELIRLKKFPNIMHLISKIRSKSYLDPFKILKSMFPAGTVSGAPKKRAMQIIHELETEDRGPYAGCVGYVSFAGDMDMAISIRTMFNKDSKYIAQAGAGIVADSKAEEEYLETENKMKGILSTINLARILEENKK